MPEISRRTTLLILHPSFALTGVVQAVCGPLLPVLAADFHLNDGESGLLLMLYFLGAATGALFCRHCYGQTITRGFAALALVMLAVVFAGRIELFPLFFLMGVAVGVPMSGGNLYVGRNFAESRAASLTFLNLTWSLGALASPVLVAPLVARGDFRVAYGALAALSAVAALACRWLPADVPEPAQSENSSRAQGAWLFFLAAFLVFLETSVENTAVAWLSTYALRSVGSTNAAAAAMSLYWMGSTLARVAASFLLLRLRSTHVLRGAVALAIAASALLVAAPGSHMQIPAMFLLGVATAPIYPLLLAMLFARTRSANARWVLATCGMGGSVLPWLAGFISNHTGSLRLGLTLIPASLITMLLLIAFLQENRGVQGSAQHS